MFERSGRMTARWMVGVLMGASLLVAGCGTKAGTHLVDYNASGNKLQEKKAAEDGRYTLHLHGEPGVTYHVVKGEMLGFRKGHDGSIQAFAGDNPAVDLQHDDARGAYWKFDRKETR
jgi:hypothetical protein